MSYCLGRFWVPVVSAGTRKGRFWPVLALCLQSARPFVSGLAERHHRGDVRAIVQDRQALPLGSTLTR